MNAQQILRSDILDIIFEGRNKGYGAYELRKTYNHRVRYALLGMATLVILVFIGRAIAGKFEVLAQEPVFYTKDVVLKTVEPDLPVPPPPVPPVKEIQPPTAAVQYTKPDIVADINVIHPPVDMHAIENARIDVKPQEGLTDQGVIAPPEIEKGTQVVAGPSESNEDNKRYITVEKDAQFPGGNAAWLKYVTRAIQSALGEFTEADYGTCQIKFVVSKTGEVSEVHAETMKGSKLAEVAVNAIRKGPKWIPALQNGRYVNAYRIQPVTLQSPIN